MSALSSDSPAPGGGSASAAAGAAGAALLGMVVRLTLGKEKFKDVWDDLKPVEAEADRCRLRLLELVDEDTKAFQAIVQARKLPKETEAQKSARAKAIDDATVLATATPMQTASFALKALSYAPLVCEKGNPNASSDAFVAALLLSSAVEGALANVRINLPSLSDRELTRGFREDALDVEQKCVKALQSVREISRARTVAV
jgi:glutamate formiminotransferase/formiminotetrahydrofolate cyclodeaminase